MRDRLPFQGRESREAKAAAAKRAAQQERVARASEAIKQEFVKRRGGEHVQDEIYGGEPPAEEPSEPE